MKIENKRYLYYAAIFLFVALVFGIYFSMFNSNLSDDSYIWSNFGNYINGFLTPLLTIINIVVFIELTIAISNIEEQRSEKALKNERQLLLMQLRKQEIDTFVKQTNRILEGKTKEEKIESLQQVADYLTSFNETGFKWFNIEDNDNTKFKISHLAVCLRTLQYDLEGNLSSQKDIFTKIYDKKAEITNALVEATLKNY